MGWVQSLIGSVADTISEGINYSGQRQASDQSGAGYSRGVSQLQNSMGQIQQAQQPWMNAGTSALQQLQQLANSDQSINVMNDAGYRPESGLTNPGNFNFSTDGPNADPSYQWRMQQGQQALEASAAAKGGYFSGQTGIDLTNYGQNAASQEYQNQFNRYQTQLSDYMGQQQFNANQYQSAYNRQGQEQEAQLDAYKQLAQMGQNATNQYSGLTSNLGSSLANMFVNQGNNSANWTSQIYGGLANTNESIANRWSGSVGGMGGGGGSFGGNSFGGGGGMATAQGQGMNGQNGQYDPNNLSYGSWNWQNYNGGGGY